MLNKKLAIASILFCGTIIFLASCYKDKTLVTNVPEVTRTVTFSQDIIPIFNESCSISGCHSSGGQKPDLTEANAYNSLATGGYVDKNTPENSVLYLKVSGQKGTPMPPTGVNKEYAVLILAWIKQGANNN